MELPNTQAHTFGYPHTHAHTKRKKKKKKGKKKEDVTTISRPQLLTSVRIKDCTFSGEFQTKLLHNFFMSNNKAIFIDTEFCLSSDFRLDGLCNSHRTLLQSVTNNRSMLSRNLFVF